jgi:hypothetical protein
MDILLVVAPVVDLDLHQHQEELKEDLVAEVQQHQEHLDLKVEIMAFNILVVVQVEEWHRE